MNVINEHVYIICKVVDEQDVFVASCSDELTAIHMAKAICNNSKGDIFEIIKSEVCPDMNSFIADPNKYNTFESTNVIWWVQYTEEQSDVILW